MQNSVAELSWNKEKYIAFTGARQVSQKKEFAELSTALPYYFIVLKS